MAKFVVFAKRVDPCEARLRVFCMTDDKEDKTLEHQEHFTEVAKSRDVEVLEGKLQYVEFAGNLIPVTKSGEQLKLIFRAFKENRLPFTVRVKDPHADAIGRTLFMKEPKVSKGDAPQQPICILNIVLPDRIITDVGVEPDINRLQYISGQGVLPGWQRLSDISNLLGEDWIQLAIELHLSTSEINHIKTELCESSVPHQALAMLKSWIQLAGNKASASTLEEALRRIGRVDIVSQCDFNVEEHDYERIRGSERIQFQRIHGKEYIKDEYYKDQRRILGQDSYDMKGMDKDDKEERKYLAEEKEVEEQKISVSERRREIEKRLSQEKDDRWKEKQHVSEPTFSESKTEVSTNFIKIDDSREKETSEEKAVSPEPSHLPFDEKLKTFELGFKPKEKTKSESIQKYIVEESKNVDKQDTSDDECLSFQEKRLSFEKGVSIKKPDDQTNVSEKRNTEREEDEKAMELELSEKERWKQAEEVPQKIFIQSFDEPVEPHEEMQWESVTGLPHIEAHVKREGMIFSPTETTKKDNSSFNDLGAKKEICSKELETTGDQIECEVHNVKDHTNSVVIEEFMKDENITSFLPENANSFSGPLNPNIQSYEQSTPQEMVNFRKSNNGSQEESGISFDKNHSNKDSDQILGNVEIMSTCDSIDDMRRVERNSPECKIGDSSETEIDVELPENSQVHYDLPKEGKYLKESQPFVTTPSFQRKGIGGSQRLASEDRPILREILSPYTWDDSSDEDNGNPPDNYYIVTEPFDNTHPRERKVQFKLDSYSNKDKIFEEIDVQSDISGIEIDCCVSDLIKESETATKPLVAKSSLSTNEIPLISDSKKEEACYDFRSQMEPVSNINLQGSCGTALNKEHTHHIPGSMNEGQVPDGEDASKEGGVQPKDGKKNGKGGNGSDGGSKGPE